MAQEITYDSLPLLGQGYSLNLAGKGHAIAKRVWKTKADMMEYLKDPNSSAVRGIILVVTDDETASNNGAYLVKQAVGDNVDTITDESLAIVKLSTGKQEVIDLKVEGSAAKDGLVKYENGTLTVEDMRSKWEIFGNL